MTIRTLVLISTFCFLSAIQAQESSTVNGNITFLQVDLVCGAASDIGCGSRSKPILLDLEGQSEIAEAWLNRPGTIIAVVWIDNQEADEILLQQTLKKHKKSGKVLRDSESTIQEEKFRTERWYRTNEVDELSIEEAGRIAECVVSEIKDQGSLSDQNALLMKKEVEEFIKNELLNLEDVSLLDKRSYYKGWETGIKEIARSYMDDYQVNNIHLFVMPPWIKSLIIGGIIILVLSISYLIIRIRSKRSLILFY